MALFVILLSSLPACRSKKSAIAYKKPDNLEECTAYIMQHHMTPEEYVLEKFTDHDVVILGEWHRIKHDPVLVQNLIPRLYEHGIYTLAIEFATYNDQPLIDRLITAPEYDEKLAKQINLDALLSIGLGGYQEYVEIFRAAWEVNRNLPEDKKKFRILGLNDTNDWSYIRTEADRNDPEIMQKVFQNSSEKNWADRLRKEVLDKGEKALCYCGMHHAFTKYRQPVVENGKFIRDMTERFGNYVYKEIGESVFTISLHSPWISAQGYEAKAVLPADGMIDYVLASLPKERQRFGFDTATSPLGMFSGETGLYKYGYERFTLKDFCDGYICQGKLAGYRPVTYIKDFVNTENLERVQRAFPNPSFRTATVKEFNDAIGSDAQRIKSIINDILRSSPGVLR